MEGLLFLNQGLINGAETLNIHVELAQHTNPGPGWWSSKVGTHYVVIEEKQTLQMIWLKAK